jgi:hypothetical protein
MERSKRGLDLHSGVERRTGTDQSPLATQVGAWWKSVRGEKKRFRIFSSSSKSASFSLMPLKIRVGRKLLLALDQSRKKPKRVLG